jgi:hypothetical protein
MADDTFSITARYAGRTETVLLSKAQLSKASVEGYAHAQVGKAFRLDPAAVELFINIHNPGSSSSVMEVKIDEPSDLRALK